MYVEHEVLVNADSVKSKLEFLSYVWIDGEPNFKIIIPELLRNSFRVSAYLNHLLGKEEGFYESHIWHFGNKLFMETAEHSPNDELKDLKGAKAVLSKGKWYVTDAEGTHVSPGFDCLEDTSQEGVYQITIGPFSGFMTVLDMEAKRVLQRELPKRFAEYKFSNKEIK